jgi:hypothetical protein
VTPLPLRPGSYFFLLFFLSFLFFLLFFAM